jgi:hypothetical protein
LVLNILFKKHVTDPLSRFFTIDLNDDGFTPNDPGDSDTGVNNLQNHPDVNNCSNSFNLSTNLVDFQCTGNLNSNVGTNFNIDFYLNVFNGLTVTQNYVGSQSVTTNAQGNAPFTFNFTTAITNGSSISAITRRSNGDTSEDSPPRQIGGTPCTYQVMPTSFTVSAEVHTGNSVTVQTQAGCSWTAVSNNGFLTAVNPPNGTGSGTVTFNIAGNTGPAPRVGTLTIAGQTVTVNQFGCTYEINPLILSFPGGASLASGPTARREFLIATQSQCGWQLSASGNFEVLLGRTVGTGVNLNFAIPVTPNGGVLRTTTVSIVGTSASLLIRQNSNNALFDFDNDNRADRGVFGPSNSLSENLPLSAVNSAPEAIFDWRVVNSSNGNATSTPFGQTDDKLVPGDYHADGKADFAVFRPSTGTWFIARPTGVPAQNFDAIPFGLSTDIPVPNDYDGDGKTDIAVFRPSTGTWWILRSIDGGLSVINWGLNGDKPVPGNYDTDGKADIAVWRPSDRTWYILNSSDSSFRFVQFGLSSDKPVPGDYDGDFLNDIAVFRPSTGEWFILQSSNNSLRGLNWGLASDKLTPADFDGDLKTDIAVWRPSTQTWFILQSSNGVPQITQQGQSGDIPIQSALIPE